MAVSSTIGSRRYTFGSRGELLAKATPPRSGDVLAGVAAESVRHTDCSHQLIVQPRDSASLSGGRRMRIMASRLFPCLVVAMALARNPCLPAQDAPTVADSSETSPLIVGHPFTAINYARRVKVLPDGKLQFIRNQRYPTRIARDADGRLMMQGIHSDQLQSECDRLDLPVPPVCPSWDVIVIDPVAHTVTHGLFPSTEGYFRLADDRTVRMLSITSSGSSFWT
jgi:hypothetical protein